MSLLSPTVKVSGCYKLQRAITQHSKYEEKDSSDLTPTFTPEFPSVASQTRGLDCANRGPPCTDSAL